MGRKTKTIIFRAHIDYNYKGKKEGKSLNLCSGTNRESGDLEGGLRSVFGSQLPEELRRIYGIEIKTQVIDIQQGSVLVYFSAMLSIAGVISNYSDFIESIKLIKDHASILAHRFMSQHYGENINVEISETFPAVPDGRKRFSIHRLRKLLGPEAEELLPLGLAFSEPEGIRPKRDAFFWYLLIANIVLLALVGLMVWDAVMKTYFG